MVLHVVEKEQQESVAGLEGAKGWGEIQGSQALFHVLEAHSQGEHLLGTTYFWTYIQGSE